MQTILISGGTGMIGQAITRVLLAKGYRVIILSRGRKQAEPGSALTYAHWDPSRNEIDPASIAAADHIIHLAGAGVADKRWTKKRKAAIVSSRVEGSRLIAVSLQQIPNKVKSVVSASAIGWYGPDPVIPNPRPFKETDTADDSFLGNTCRLWEEAIEPAVQSGKRLVRLRIGIVLANEGGAFGEFHKPLRFGLATILGNGKQIISWIHVDDLVRLFIYMLENETATGVYNAVAPAPVPNKELILSLARERKKFYIPIRVPSFMLKLMLGEMSVEILKSVTVSAQKVQEAGFSFQYPEIRSALRSLLAPRDRDARYS